MNFLRVNYLEGNYNVHASAHSVIGDAEFDKHIYTLRPSALNERTHLSAARLVFIFGFMSHLLAKSVAVETEEWDGFLLAAEITRVADQVAEKIYNWPTSDQAVQNDAPSAA